MKEKRIREDIDYNVVMQVFRYIAFIREDCEKEMEKAKPGASRTKDSPEYLLKLMSQIIDIFLSKLNVPQEEADAFTNRIKERKMGDCGGKRRDGKSGKRSDNGRAGNGNS